MDRHHTYLLGTVLMSLICNHLSSGLTLSGSASYAVLDQTFQFTLTVTRTSSENIVIFRRNTRSACTIAYPLNSTQCQQFTAVSGYSCSCGENGVYYMDISSVSLQDEDTWDCQFGLQLSNNISLPVYYGPFSNLTIDKPSPVTVVEGVTAGSLSARCSAHCNPGCSYTWRKESEQVHSTSDLPLGSFRRGQGGDYTCRARNTATGATADSLTLTVIVQYPPLVSPVISGISIRPVYEDDKVTLTCRVTGGNPLVTTVTLTCPGGHQSSSTKTKGNDTRVTTLTFPVNRNLRSQPCRCSAVHSTGRYQLTANMTNDNVYYPPSIQTVSVSPSLPWLEGRSGTLTCVLSDAGHPSATYIWYRDGVRQTQQTGQSWLFSSLTYSDNGRQIYCQAENQFTEDRGPSVKSSNVTINVYFSPRVQTFPSSNVTKIERDSLTVNCTAVSNPQPTGYQWTFGSVAKSNGPQLSLPDLDRSDHREYRCTVTTQAGSHGSLTGTATVQVIVNYSPEVTLTNVTETETQRATVTCLADGRPENFYFFPFVHTWRGHVIRHVTGQKVGKEYRNVFPSSSYQDSGVYVCEVENGVPDRQGVKNKKGSIFVQINASPKLTVGMKKEDLVEAEVGQMVTLFRTFYSKTSITSYTWSKDGQTLNNTRMSDTTVQLDIYGVRVDDVGYNLTLDVGQFEKDTDSGQYSLRVCNSIGCETATVTLKLQETMHLLPGSVAAIVGGCVAGVVAVCLLTAGLVILYRKGYRCNCCIFKQDARSQKQSERGETSDVDDRTYSTIGPEVSERRNQYSSLENTELQQYTGLQLYENTEVAKETEEGGHKKHGTYEPVEKHTYENTGATEQETPNVN